MKENTSTLLKERCDYYYVKFYKLILYMCLKRLGLEDAKDVTQTVFLTLFTKYVSEDKKLTDEQIKALLFRITSSKIVDLTRKSGRTTIDLDTFNASEYTGAIPKDTVENHVIVNETLRNVVEEIDNMTEEWQTIIYLTAYGVKPEEIASKLNISIPNVRMKLSRIRKRLKKKYGDSVTEILF